MHIHSGDWAQAKARALPPDVHPLFLILAIDETHLTQYVRGKQAHPLYVTLGNIDRNLQRSPLVQRICALFPILKGTSQEQKRVAFKRRKLEIWHQSLAKALQGNAEICQWRRTTFYRSLHYVVWHCMMLYVIV